MQISIYLDDKLIQKVDQRATKGHTSRSAYIQDILKKEIMGENKESIFEEVFGLMDEKSAKSMIQSIKSNHSNSSRFK